MYRDIIDGYIYDVTKSLPRKDRNKVEEILYDEIYIRLEEEQRAKDYDEPTIEDVKIILEDLGNPRDIQKRFTTKDDRSHIPQPYLRHFRMDLSLGVLFALITFIGIYALNIRNDRTIDTLVNNGITTLGTLIKLYVTMYFLYSATFARVSRKRLKKSVPVYVDTIKAKPTRSNTIGKINIIGAVLVSTVLMAIFGFGYTLLDISYPTIVFLDQYVLGLFPIIAIVYAINILSIAYREIDRRYTTGVLVTTILTHLGRVLVAGILFGLHNTVDPRIEDIVARLLPDSSISFLLLSNLGLSIFLVVVGLAVLNIVYVAMSFHSDKKGFSPHIVVEEELVEEEYPEVEEPEIKEVPIVAPVVDDAEVTEDIEPTNSSDEDDRDNVETIIVDDTPVTSDDLGDTRVVYIKEDIEEDIDTSTQDPSSEQKTNSVADAIRNANPDSK